VPFVGQTSASNESTKLQAVLETDASLLDLHRCVDRCELTVLRTEVGRCNRSELRNEVPRLLKACSAPLTSSGLADRESLQRVLIRVYFTSMLAVERSGLKKQTGPVSCGDFFRFATRRNSGRHRQLRLSRLPSVYFGLRFVFRVLLWICIAFGTRGRRGRAILGRSGDGLGQLMSIFQERSQPGKDRAGSDSTRCSLLRLRCSDNYLAGGKIAQPPKSDRRLRSCMAGHPNGAIQAARCNDRLLLCFGSAIDRGGINLFCSTATEADRFISQEVSSRLS
jgi:hypothetical protein